jgi:hypothetical protein
MEAYSNLAAYKKHPLSQVNLQIIPETFQSSLKSYLKFVEKSSNLEELHENLKKSGHKLNKLDAFDECRIEVRPGSTISSAVPVFMLKSKNQFVGMPFISNDPLTFGVHGEVRNVFGSVNIINFNFGLVAENSFKTFLIDYCSKIGVFHKYQCGFEIKKEFKYLDLNADELSHTAGIYIKTLDNKHAWNLGFSLRNNNIYVNNASSELIKQGLLPNSKNFLSYSYKNRDLVGFGVPFQFNWMSELAFTDKLGFLRVEQSVSKVWNFFSYYLQAKVSISNIFPLQSDKIVINDRLRHKNVKGFRFLGRREEAHDQVLAGNLEVSGDHLGSNMIGSAEALLYHRSFPFLSRFGIHPFLFASAAYLNELNHLRENNTRAAFGLGLSYLHGSNLIELVYTSYSIHRAGDTPAEFQILFTSR